MLVLGVDPGTATTGYGIVRTTEGKTKSRVAPAALVECGTIRTDPDHSFAARLDAIFGGVVAVVERHHPDVVVVENIFYGRNVRTTVVLGHVRGVILLAGHRAGAMVHELPPATIKKAVVGTGNATKEQVQFMIQRLLRLEHPPEPSDAADGVAAALAYCLFPPIERLVRDIAIAQA